MDRKDPLIQSSRRTQTWIAVAMYLCVAAIVVGVAVPSGWTQTKIIVMHTIFLFALLTQFLLPYFFPQEEVQPKFNSTICLNTLLIWLPFPLSAGLNAWGFAAGLYDPIVHDGYPYALSYWWIGIAGQIAIGIAITTWYFWKLTRNNCNDWLPKTLLYSWAFQVVAWLAWGFGPLLGE